MKVFRVELEGAQARVILAIPLEGGFVKKSFIAKDAEELWEGLRALERIEKLSAEDRTKALGCMCKAEERAFLSTAIPEWLSKGNRIKVLPPEGGKKLRLSEKEQEDILALLKDLELDGPDVISSPEGVESPVGVAA